MKFMLFESSFKKVRTFLSSKETRESCPQRFLNYQICLLCAQSISSLFLVFLVVNSAFGEEKVEAVAEDKMNKPEAKEPQKETKTSGHPFSWGFMKWEQMKPYGGNTKGTETILDTDARASYSAIYEEGIGKKEQDRRAILSLVGNYRVTFDFIETAGTEKNYKPQRPYFSWATEKVFLIEESADFISLQHILVMEFIDKDGNIQGPFTMKHWRQDWRYEDSKQFQYQGDRNWRRVEIEPVAGSWTQEVYQVDDSPRYEATGYWNHTGGLSTFSTSNFWRPLPRREFSIRFDYNVLAGQHDITVNPTGWVHLQRNRKEVVENGKVTSTLATEIGAVRYESIKKPDLSLADNYWKKTAPYWEAVRQKWKEVYAEKESFKLEKKIDDKGLFMHHFAHAGEIEEADNPDYEEFRKKARETIERFMK